MSVPAPVIAVSASLCAAMGFAAAQILQQEAAQSVSADASLRPRILFDLLRRPRWLAGVAMLLVGFGCQALALAYGPIALVQPIVITELAFAIPLAIWRRRRRAGRREWAGIACVLTGVGLFLALADPAPGIANPSGWDWIVALVPAGGLIAGATVLASRAQGPRRAMLLGAASGLSFGLLAALTKTATFFLGHDLASAWSRWQLYLVVGLGIFALLLSQSAYQAGPLAFSVPVADVLDPLVGVVIGTTAFDERVNVGVGPLAGAMAAGAIACAGIVLLATSPTVLSIYEDWAGVAPEALVDPSEDEGASGSSAPRDAISSAPPRRRPGRRARGRAGEPAGGVGRSRRSR